jgi:hypothetical protein
MAPWSDVRQSCFTVNITGGILMEKKREREWKIIALVLYFIDHNVPLITRYILILWTAMDL